MKKCKKVTWMVAFIALQGVGITALITIWRDAYSDVVDQLLGTFVVIFVWALLVMKGLKNCECDTMKKSMK